MAPSRPLRRPAAASLVLVCALVAQAPVARAGDPRDRRTTARQGERGSGIPMVPLAPLARMATTVKWSDVPNGYWAARAIDYVAGEHRWMRDWSATEDGTFPFRPGKLESRRLFARAVVGAFATSESPDASITFPDMAATNGFYPYANVAVKLGWMRTDADGSFRPKDPITTREAHIALVKAVGLGRLAAAAAKIHLHDGTRFHVSRGWGALLIGMRIGLRYNHGDESLDVLPDSPLPRSEVAWSLYRAATMPSYMADSLAEYGNIELPNVGPKKQAFIQWGIDYVGYPYVWGGEWDRATSTGYCCGTQPVGGFDCSGLTWWVMKALDKSWTPPRPYAGWALPQRTSTDMASTGGRVRWGDLQAGDLMFYDGDRDGRVDHVDTYIGRGWAIDSSSSPGGVTIMWIGDGWYADHFVHGRRIVGTSS
jgi:NlpC/P60 family